MEKDIKLPAYDYDSLGGRAIWLKEEENFHNQFMRDCKQMERDLISWEINTKLQPLKDEIELLKSEILLLKNK